MGHDDGDHRVLELGLVEVDGDVDLFLPDHQDHRMTGLFRQRPVGAARPGAVEVADVYVCQFLSAGIVDVDLGIWPLVERIGPTSNQGYGTVMLPEYLLHGAFPEIVPSSEKLSVARAKKACPSISVKVQTRSAAP